MIGKKSKLANAVSETDVGKCGVAVLVATATLCIATGMEAGQ